MPHWSQIIVGLLDEPYLLKMHEAVELTPRQVYFLYYRERDKNGIPKPLPYYFEDKATKLNNKITMIKQMGKSLGKSDEEIQEMVNKLIEEDKNGEE